MDLGILGKVALATGSTAGIGFAAAAALAREGAVVKINGRTPARVQEAVSQLLGLVPEGNIEGFSADLGTAKGCAGLLKQLPEVDILVNNVGIFEPKPFEKIPDEDW